jgi:hypothetical protein
VITTFVVNEFDMDLRNKPVLDIARFVVNEEDIVFKAT